MNRHLMIDLRGQLFEALDLRPLVVDRLGAVTSQTKTLIEGLDEPY